MTREELLMALDPGGDHDRMGALIDEYKSQKDNARGSGDFSIGSQVWPGTSKLLEEMGELQQVIGKLIAIHGQTNHWSGDLRKRMIEEAADVLAALRFFTSENLTSRELLQISKRADEKETLFFKWHSEGDPPP